MRACLRAMQNRLIGVVMQHPEMSLMTGFGAARSGTLAARLLIGRRRLGRSPRGLARALKLQHQLNQLRLAQTLQIIPIHPDSDSEPNRFDRGVSN